MRTRHFRELQIWQRSMMLAKSVYQATSTFPKDEVFGLRSQIRRAAVSVPSNIAEGHGRLNDRVFRIFIGYARGSLYELETQLQLSSDLDLVHKDVAAPLLTECIEINKMINSFLGTLRASAKKPSR